MAVSNVAVPEVTTAASDIRMSSYVFPLYELNVKNATPHHTLTVEAKLPLKLLFDN